MISLYSSELEKILSIIVFVEGVTLVGFIMNGISKFEAIMSKKVLASLSS